MCKINESSLNVSLLISTCILTIQNARTKHHNSRNVSFSLICIDQKGKSNDDFNTSTSKTNIYFWIKSLSLIGYDCRLSLVVNRRPSCLRSQFVDQQSFLIWHWSQLVSDYFEHLKNPSWDHLRLKWLGLGRKTVVQLFYNDLHLLRSGVHCKSVAGYRAIHSKSIAQQSYGNLLLLYI